MTPINALCQCAIVFLQPLGLPAAVGITLLAAIVPVTDPFITLVNVYGNCVTTIVVAKKRERRKLWHRKKLDIE